MKKRVQIIAPAYSYPATNKELKKIADFFKTEHFHVAITENALKQPTPFGATDAQKIADLEHAFTANVPIVLAMRGGYGSARLLPLINWRVLKKSPALFVGFSDLTTFQNAYYAKTGKPSLSGFMAKSVLENNAAKTATAFWKCLSGADFTFADCDVLSENKSTVSGTLIGGNLSCFESLIGTPYMPKLKGKILLLEDVDEAPYRIDRMLTHLQNAGVFDKVSGVVLGSFYQCKNPTKPKEKVAPILENFFQNFKKPVLCCDAYGHHPNHTCLPIGTKATLNATKKTIDIQGIRPII